MPETGLLTGVPNVVVEVSVVGAILDIHTELPPSSADIVATIAKYGRGAVFGQFCASGIQAAEKRHLMHAVPYQNSHGYRQLQFWLLR
jgi:hypothetical protein